MMLYRLHLIFSVLYCWNAQILGRSKGGIHACIWLGQSISLSLCVCVFCVGRARDHRNVSTIRANCNVKDAINQRMKSEEKEKIKSVRRSIRSIRIWEYGEYKTWDLALILFVTQIVNCVCVCVCDAVSLNTYFQHKIKLLHRLQNDRNKEFQRPTYFCLTLFSFFNILFLSLFLSSALICFARSEIRSIETCFSIKHIPAKRIDWPATTQFFLWNWSKLRWSKIEWDR